MERRLVLGIMLTLLLVGALTSAFNLAIAGVGEVAGEGELSSSASPAPSLIWSKTYGGDADDEAYCVRQTSDEGYILVGYTYSFGAGNTDVWLVKTDLNGNIEWNRTYGGADVDWGYSGQQTSDGGYIIAGGSYSFSEYPRFYLVKTDSGGNLEWNRTYDHGIAHTRLESFVQQTSDGGYIFAGRRFPLTKTDANGNVEWYKDVNFPSEYESWAESVQQTSDGGYMVAGTLWYPTPIGDYYSCWLVKTNASGNIEWNKLYGGTKEKEGAHYGQQTTDGGYMLAGWFIPPGEFRRDYLLVKTDANGNMEWNRTYGGEYKERAYSGQQTSDGGYILAGWGDIVSSPGFRVWLVKTDSNGNMEWNATYGEDDWAGQAVQQTSEGEYVVTGFTDYYHMGGKDRNVFLMKLAIEHDIAITDVQPSKSVVAQNDSVSINVTVENQGDFDETFNVTLYVDTTEIGTQEVTLTSGNSTTITFTWDTTGFEGVCTISANATTVPDETDTVDNSYTDGTVRVARATPAQAIWMDSKNTTCFDVGETFVVDVLINITDPDPLNSPPDGLWGFDFKLKWSSTILEVVEIQTHTDKIPSGDRLPGWTDLFVVINETGSNYHWYSVVAMTGTAFTGVASLCTYTFRVISDGSCALNIYDDELVDDTATLIAHTTVDGRVTVANICVIRADGSVFPPTAPISSVDNIIYTFTGNIEKTILVERDNIVVDGAGYIVQRTGAWVPKGIDLTGRSNVTIKNMRIENFGYGIWLEDSSNNSIFGNDIILNGVGVWLEGSSNNSISGNEITECGMFGVVLNSSSNNIISGNDMTNNGFGIALGDSSNNILSGNSVTYNYADGFYLELSSNNTVFGNIITNSLWGIELYRSSNNSIYHNNFVDNTGQVYTEDSVNVWDDGYPSGGNYWNDHNPPDLYSGPYQNETGSDGIGDAPYIIDRNNSDRYPLIYPYGYVPSPDVNDDGTIDIFDVVIAADAFGSKPGDDNWDSRADIANEFGLVDIFDFMVVAAHFGETH